MPLPKPKTGEANKDFVSRCMGDVNAVREFPDEKQRAGYCFKAWDERTKLEKLSLEVRKLIEILKGKMDKYDRIALKLAQTMITTWNKDYKVAIADVIRTIKRTGPYKNIPMTKTDIDAAIQGLGDYLGQNIVGEMNTPAFQTIDDIYINEIKTITGTAAGFNLADQAAIKWTQANSMYWIGQHYDDHLSETVNLLAKRVLKDGMDRQSAAAFFQKNLGKLFARSSAYWDLLSNHIVTRSREFGRTSAYQKAGIEFLKFKAVLDHRTTTICKSMHNRVIPTQWSVAVRDKLVNSKNPESVKKISPWLSEKQVSEKVVGKKTVDIPRHVGLPPLHARCRSRTVRSRQSAWNEQLKSEAQTIKLGKPKQIKNVNWAKKPKPVKQPKKTPVVTTPKKMPPAPKAGKAPKFKELKLPRSNDWTAYMTRNGGQRWIKDIEAREDFRDIKKALEHYKGAGYQTIGKYLRGTVDFDDPDLENRLKWLVDKLDKDIKGKLAEDLYLFRAHQDPKVTRAFDRGKLIGTTIQDKGYLSTSLNKRLGYSWGDIGQSVVLKIRAKKGSNVAFLEKIRDMGEAEIMLPRNSKLRVISQTLEQTARGPQRVVECEYIGGK